MKLTLFCIKFLLITLTINTYCQTEKIDSLKKLLSGNENSYKTRIEIMNTIAEEYYYLNIDSAKQYAENALNKSKESGFKQEKAEALKHLGNIYYLMADLEKAISYYESARELYKGMEDQEGISKILNNLGNIRTFQGKFVEALAFYRQSLEYEKEFKNETGIARCLHNLACVHENIGNYSQALEYYHEALRIIDKKKISKKKQII